MAQRDIADELCTRLQAEYLDDLWPIAQAVLHVEETWVATGDSVKVLIADDSPPTPLLHRHFAEPLIRVTTIARNRTQARQIATGVADWFGTLRIPGIRLKAVSTLAEGRGRSTGNMLVFFTVPAITRPVS